MKFLKKRHQSGKRHQAGISLLEVLLSLSIIAIILIMATRYFFVANENKNINQMRRQIAAVEAGIQLWKGSQPDFSGLSNMQDLIDNGDFPQSDNVKSGVLYGPWGNSVTISPSTNSVSITTTLPNQGACTKLRSAFPEAQACSNGTFTLVVGIPAS